MEDTFLIIGMEYKQRSMFEFKGSIGIGPSVLSLGLLSAAEEVEDSGITSIQDASYSIIFL